jgi:hypothetical protein
LIECYPSAINNPNINYELNISLSDKNGDSGAFAQKNITFT